MEAAWVAWNRHRYPQKCGRSISKVSPCVASRSREYFHVVFTLPHQVNALAQGNPRLISARDTCCLLRCDALNRIGPNRADRPHFGQSRFDVSIVPISWPFLSKYR